MDSIETSYYVPADNIPYNSNAQTPPYIFSIFPTFDIFSSDNTYFNYNPFSENYFETNPLANVLLNGNGAPPKATPKAPPKASQKAPPCKWTGNDTELFLSLLKKEGNKKMLKELADKRGGSRFRKSYLWNNVASKLSNNRFTPYQCEIKWKNIKQVRK
ncbi:17000_t:CDS:2, partial [Funneliformis caledonium]